MRNPVGARERRTRAGAALALVVLVCLAATTDASAQVLVKPTKPTTVECGVPVHVGIRYQGSMRAPHWARIAIRMSSGRLVWSRSATARATWRNWYVYTLCGQHYVLTYMTPSGTSRFPFYVT